MHSAPVVLTRAQAQVEIYIAQNPDSGDFTVLAFSGQPDAAPTRSVGQGPFATREAAQAVQNAIAQALQRSGYLPSADAIAVWRFHANQQQLNIIREVSQHRPDCSFDPSQVLLDDEPEKD